MKSTSTRARTQKTQIQDMSNAEHQPFLRLNEETGNRLERRIIKKLKRNKKR